MSSGIRKQVLVLETRDKQRVWFCRCGFDEEGNSYEVQAGAAGATETAAGRRPSERKTRQHFSQPPRKPAALPLFVLKTVGEFWEDFKFEFSRYECFSVLRTSYYGFKEGGGNIEEGEESPRGMKTL